MNSFESGAIRNSCSVDACAWVMSRVTRADAIVRSVGTLMFDPPAHGLSPAF